MASILDPEIGITYEWDYFNFNIPILPTPVETPAPVEGQPPPVTPEPNTVEAISIEEIFDQEIGEMENKFLEYELGPNPSISGYFDSVFDQTEYQSYRQEPEFNNVYTTVSKASDIPDQDIHIIKYRVDPRQQVDRHFKVTVLEMPINQEFEIDIWIKVLNNYDRSRMIFLNKLNEVESRG